MGNVNAAAEEDSQDLQESQVPSKGNTRDMTVEQLARYNGQNDRPSYIALNGEIFDVSQEKDPDICLAPFTESIGTNKEVDDATMCAFRERYVSDNFLFQRCFLNLCEEIFRKRCRISNHFSG